MGGGRVIGGSTVGRHHRRPTRTIIYGQARAMLRAADPDKSHVFLWGLSTMFTFYFYAGEPVWPSGKALGY